MSIENKMIDSKKRYIQSLEHSEDITSRILLTHLYFEFLLERYISTKLKSTKKLFGKSGLSFKHKLNLADSFGELNQQLYDGIDKTNTIRNDVAHTFQYQISDESITDLARTTGKKYKVMKKQSADSRELLDRTLDLMVGKFSGFVDLAEIKLNQ